MALYDTDKNSEDRGAPTPNHSDQIIDGATRNHGTLSINPVTNATSTNGYISTKTQAVIANDGTANKALMGYQQGLGKWGLFVAQDGTDVTTNTDLSKFLINSGQDAFKIVLSGTATRLVPSLTSGSTDTTTVAHNLGFIPAVVAYVNGSGSTYLAANRYYQMPQAISVAVGGKYEAGIVYSFNVDSTNLYFTVSNFSSASPITDIGTANWKYHLLQETAN